MRRIAASMLALAVAALAAFAGPGAPPTVPPAPVAPAAANAAEALPPLDFGRDVRPILSDRCFGCHGPDAGKRRSGLRLDTAEGARRLLESGARAVVPGDLHASELAARIQSDDEDEVMPPPSLKRPLTDDERSVLLRWIREGAAYAPHWAFVAPAAHAVPVVRDASWVRDPVDAFVLARLEAEGLAPEPEADRAVLLRRASLALTGLPPTPEEADAFTADRAPDAYERRVDAMLASQRAAEHLAATWLDLARYADTYGYQSDADCFTWPWRDWLLRALDANMPYDRFAQAIVAGDLLPGATQDDRVATAFNRLHRMTEEGGSIAEEFRQEGIADRVATFGTAFLGLTLECARCHDHKYDPVPTREFYGLAAMFGRVDENGLKPFAIPAAVPPPSVRLETPEQAARTLQLQAAADAASAALEAAAREAQAQVDPAAAPTCELPPPAAQYRFDELAEGRTPNDVAGAPAATTDRHRPEQLGAVSLVAGRAGRAILFDGDGGLWLDGLSGLTRHDPLSVACWLRPGERNARATLLHASGFYTNEADASGPELLIVDGRLRWSIISLWPGSAISIETIDPLPVGEWTHAAFTYDGCSRAEGLAIAVNGVPAPVRVVRDRIDGPIATHTLELGSRSRDAGFRGGAIDQLAVWRAALTPAQCALAAGRECDGPARRAHAAAVAIEPARARLRNAQRALAAHLEAIPALLCMRDSPDAPPTFVLPRGRYDQPDRAQPVAPGAIEAVLPADPARMTDRRALAAWLVDPRNPLTARVEVNRLWAQLFGRGLVESNENFGLQGAWPSHPELLDALAHDFARGPHAWDRKALLRRLALSATFRQASSAAPAKVARDPRNALLSRGPGVRLSAEQLRDSALLASGLLVHRLGGPSARPWQQPGLANETGQGGNYVPDAGEGAHRRSLYTHRKRTVPPPTMLSFDAGTRESCQPRRSATNTPLQALALLNDPVFTECARALAARAARAAADRDARIVHAFRLLCTRAPRAAELDALRTLVASQSAAFAADRGAAARVAGSDDPELAALVLACSTIMASDGAVMSR